MSLSDPSATSSTGRSRIRPTMNDVFNSMEQEMLAPWGFASRFPTARDMLPAFAGSSNVVADRKYLDMNLDFHETSNGFELTADLPGMRQEDISIDVDKESGVLTVSGERKSEREEKGDGEDGERKYHFVERSYGKTSRSIRLPETADTANAAAGLANGVLTVTFPKREVPVSRLRIPVGGGGPGDNKISVGEGNPATGDGATET